MAAPEPTKLTIDVKKVSTPVEVPATGPDLTWKTVTLGTIDLPAGPTGFEIKGVKDGWKGLSVRHVYLEPADSTTATP